MNGSLKTLDFLFLCCSTVGVKIKREWSCWLSERVEPRLSFKSRSTTLKFEFSRDLFQHFFYTVYFSCLFDSRKACALQRWKWIIEKFWRFEQYSFSQVTHSQAPKLLRCIIFRLSDSLAARLASKQLETCALCRLPMEFTYCTRPRACSRGEFPVRNCTEPWPEGTRKSINNSSCKSAFTGKQ